ncbi:zinc-ribbon domain-containing protein, partial [Paracoccus liaowanqingii]|uniref:zinc-ribbon domain-containing protein n=1 Tax=Paracoccus liaowanqingii TaxID=2560053 RepID=UPI0030B889FE
MAEIELICPGCGADYALPAGAIPPAGREVECSRCGHVWQATPPAPEGPLDLGSYTRPKGAARV